MSETRGHNLYQKGGHKFKHEHTTVFPADFFSSSRSSDPRGKHLAVITSPQKKSPDYQKQMESPMKTNGSNSSTRFSREEVDEEEFRLPKISNERIEVQIKDFVFPFKKNDQKGHSERKLQDDSINSAGISSTRKGSAKVVTSAYKQGKSSIDYSRLSSNSSCAKSSNLEKSQKRGMGVSKYSLVTDFHHDGYDTDDHKAKSKRKYNSAFKPKGMNSSLKSQDGLKNSVLPIYESSTEDGSPIFDKHMENVMEELWRLADEDTSLPDIYERQKAMEATFQFNKETAHDEEYVSFDKLLEKELSKPTCPMSVKVRSSKAAELNLTPFTLSDDNPETLAKQTAYFGHCKTN